jgi:crotonobetainyl-CoA:carnitine CoA-transferase CaiB-like acyl-CoA transferase
VPVGPVNTVEDVFADPFVAARQTVHRFVREDGVEIPTVAFPGKLSATPADYRYQPPKTGEQSRELLGEWLRLDEAELDALEASGTVKQA